MRASRTTLGAPGASRCLAHCPTRTARCGRRARGGCAVVLAVRRSFVSRRVLPGPRHEGCQQPASLCLQPPSYKADQPLPELFAGRWWGPFASLLRTGSSSMIRLTGCACCLQDTPGSCLPSSKSTIGTDLPIPPSSW
eukprot:scaffold659_cov329-Prasinococcus_capsulatus_cf.AAC.33